jgi:hypothetical protein
MGMQGDFVSILGPLTGTDIESVNPSVVAAETFAAVRPSSNKKLSKDLQKLVRTCPDAKARMCFLVRRVSSTGGN